MDSQPTTTDKIGIAIITCNRIDTFKKCLASMPKSDILIVVNDGSPYPPETYQDRKIDAIIQHPRNLNVAVAKNAAIRKLIQLGCTHLFLCEDDIEVVNPNICNAYIAAAAKSGIWHLNFALHGDANKNADGTPKIKNSVDYGDGITVNFFHNVTGAWSYYHKQIIKLVGYMDERFNNAMEHVEHTIRVINEQLHPPFWWFADIANSETYINDLDADLRKSVIRSNLQWEHNLRSAYNLMMHKHKVLPANIPDVSPEQAMETISKLHEFYQRPDLFEYYGHPTTTTD